MISVRLVPSFETSRTAEVVPTQQFSTVISSLVSERPQAKHPFSVFFLTKEVFDLRSKAGLHPVPSCVYMLFEVAYTVLLLQFVS